MTLESSDWCVPSSASNFPTWDSMPESVYVAYTEDFTRGTITDNGDVTRWITVKATSSNVNTHYSTAYSDIRTQGTPTTLVDSNSDPIKVYEYVDAQTIAVTSDSSWVEGKAYFIRTQGSK